MPRSRGKQYSDRPGIRGGEIIIGHLATDARVGFRQFAEISRDALFLLIGRKTAGSRPPGRPGGLPTECRARVAHAPGRLASECVLLLLLMGFKRSSIVSLFGRRRVPRTRFHDVPSRRAYATIGRSFIDFPENLGPVAARPAVGFLVLTIEPDVNRSGGDRLKRFSSSDGVLVRFFFYRVIPE